MGNISTLINLTLWIHILILQDSEEGIMFSLLRAHHVRRYCVLMAGEVIPLRFVIQRGRVQVNENLWGDRENTVRTYWELACEIAKTLEEEKEQNSNQWSWWCKSASSLRRGESHCHALGCVGTRLLQSLSRTWVCRHRSVTVIVTHLGVSAHDCYSHCHALGCDSHTTVTVIVTHLGVPAHDCDSHCHALECVSTRL